MVGYHKVKDTLKDKLKIIQENPFIIDNIIEALAYEKDDEKAEII